MSFLVCFFVCFYDVIGDTFLAFFGFLVNLKALVAFASIQDTHMCQCRKFYFYAQVFIRFLLVNFYGLLRFCP